MWVKWICKDMIYVELLSYLFAKDIKEGFGGHIALDLDKFLGFFSTFA